MQMSVEWMERHQVALYVAGLAIGAVVGLGGPEFLRLGRRWIGA